MGGGISDSGITIPPSGLGTIKAEVVELESELEFPSHAVGLEPMKTLKGGVAMRKPPSHPVGLEQEKCLFITSNGFMDLSPSHSVGSEHAKQLQEREAIRQVSIPPSGLRTSR